MIVLSLSTACGTIPPNTQITFPTPSPSISAGPTVTMPASGREVSYLGTSFTIPAGLARGTQKDSVPSSSPDGPAVYPAHTRIVLQGYLLQNTTYEPQIMVYPAEEYQQMSNDPAVSQYDAKTMINNLQEILRTQTFPSQGTLPALPEMHAVQVFHAQEAILAFGNGNGIRYIPSYSQAAFPSVNSDILYTFQGITQDGRSYVSVVLPIELADLDPAPENADQYPNYLSTSISRINQAGDQFNPSLASLDALVQSLLAGG